MEGTVHKKRRIIEGTLGKALADGCSRVNPLPFFLGKDEFSALLLQGTILLPSVKEVFIMSNRNALRLRKFL